MLIVFKDRVRLSICSIPAGTTKFISIDALLPLIIIPLILGIAAVNIYCCIIIYILLPIFLIYAYYYLQKYNTKTKFFYLWAIGSNAYIWILFEITVPLTELLPQENFLYILLFTCSLYCFYKTKQRGQLNFLPPSVASQNNDLLDDITEVGQDENENNKDHHHLHHSTTILIDESRPIYSTMAFADNDDDGEDADGNPNDNDNHHHNDINQITNHCLKCHKYVPPRTYHCTICTECVRKCDHHNIWLDCCIGLANQRYFIIGCYFSFCTFLLGSNLALTSVCHPFLFINFFGIFILLPDDCNDVFDQYDVALCFVASIYSLFLMGFMFSMLSKQFMYVFRGVTEIELKLGKRSKSTYFSNFKDLFFTKYEISK